MIDGNIVTVKSHKSISQSNPNAVEKRSDLYWYDDLASPPNDFVLKPCCVFCLNRRRLQSISLFKASNERTDGAANESSVCVTPWICLDELLN